LELYKRLKAVVQYNKEQLKKVDWDQNYAEGLITLHEENEGIDVWDPFHDTTLRFDVDPITEYGESKVTDMVLKYEKIREGKIWI
jgi:hypothetical protein